MTHTPIPITLRVLRAVLSVLAGAAVLAAVSVGHPTPAFAASGVDNAAIANKALAYNGQFGGNACADANKSGYTDAADGQCRTFVNCVIKIATGLNVAYGSEDYQRAFREQGGQPISRTGGMRGDIIQYGNGGHTAIILSNRDNNGTYQVVDSNFNHDGMVRVHDWTMPSSAQIWRMGTVRISLRALAANKWTSAELGYGGADYGMARGRADNIGGWERFSLLGDCSRQCAIRSEGNGKFLSAELGYQAAAYGEVRARADNAQGWEQFRFVGNPYGSFGLLALGNNQYVSVEMGYSGNGANMLRARAGSIGGWEQFRIAE